MILVEIFEIRPLSIITRRLFEILCEFFDQTLLNKNYISLNFSALEEKRFYSGYIDSH